MRAKVAQMTQIMAEEKIKLEETRKKFSELSAQKSQLQEAEKQRLEKWKNLEEERRRKKELVEKQKLEEQRQLYVRTFVSQAGHKFYTFFAQ